MVNSHLPLALATRLREPDLSNTPTSLTSDQQPHIVVVGSINMDLVTRVTRLPRPGQTVVGRELQRIPGGKGANQAVAAARLSARCSMIGRVGDDGFGVQLIDSLRSYGVDTAGVRISSDTSSGIALIGVDDEGENAITIVVDIAGSEQPVRAGDNSDRV